MVSGASLLSLLILDVLLWKACVVTLAIYVCMVIPIGRRAVEASCALMFAVAMAKWTDIGRINEVAGAAKDSLIHLAALRF